MFVQIIAAIIARARKHTFCHTEPGEGMGAASPFHLATCRGMSHATYALEAPARAAKGRACRVNNPPSSHQSSSIHSVAAAGKEGRAFFCLLACFPSESQSTEDENVVVVVFFLFFGERGLRWVDGMVSNAELYCSSAESKMLIIGVNVSMTAQTSIAQPIHT